MPQYEVVFLPAGKCILANEGMTLLQAARMGGCELEAPCDGRGTCGKCHVRAVGKLSTPQPSEIEQLGELLVADVRLACQAKVYGPVRAEVLFNRGDTFVALTAGQSGKWLFDPPVRSVLSEYIADQAPLANAITPFFQDSFPDMLQEMARENNQGLTHCEAIIKQDKLLDWRFQPGRALYGIAVDIGTTSVVAELVDLTTGQSLGVHSCLNPQTEFGGDVLTRISFAGQHADGTRVLQKKIVDGINRLIAELTTTPKLQREDIYEIVLAGNTTMLHLLLGVAPRSLAHAPYRPIFTQQLEVRPTTIGLRIASRGVVTVLPSAAAFVGADIVAGLLATGLHRYQKTAIFIDIGTNGEIVVCQKGLLVGTSSAAGPALEGMNITCGCRAEQGAIEGVAIASDGAVSIKVIGDVTPKGICGSGLIDLVSELVKNGVIEKNGRFAKQERMVPSLAARLVDCNGQQAFLLSEAGAVFLSQKDVRQVQLAKGAITAAIDLLLQDINISYTDVDEVLVAGAFGFHLKPSSLVGIGLLPLACKEKIHFVGNTAKEGAKAVLLSRAASREIIEIGQSLTIKELSLHPEFQDYFVRALAFPKV